jgi:hypothetical protein
LTAAFTKLIRFSTLTHKTASSGRIAYQFDYTDDDGNASDELNHGTPVAGIIAEMTQAELVILKVFDSLGQFVEQDFVSALTWIEQNADDYNIVAVNMSFGDLQSHATDQTDNPMHNVLGQLAEDNIAVIASTGNLYADFNLDGDPTPQPGVQYPAADESVIAVGATWADDFDGPSAFTDPNSFNVAWDYTQVPDQIAAFGQRHPAMVDLMAPGASLTTPSAAGGTISQGRGTSGAAPHVTAAVALAQHLNAQFGYQPGLLNKGQLVTLLKDTGVNVFDGDNEDDNVINTSTAYKRLNIEAMAYKLFKPAAPDLVNTSDWGFSEIDNKTYDLTPTFTGSAPPNSHVWVYVDGVEKGNGQANGSGVYSITTSSLSAGLNQSVTIKVAENSLVPAENRSQFSPGISLNVSATDSVNLATQPFAARMSETLVVSGSNTGSSTLTADWATAPPRALTKTGAGTVTINAPSERNTTVTYNADGGTTIFAADMGVSGIPGVSTRLAQWTVNADATVDLATTHNLAALNVEDAGLVTLLQNGNRVLVVNTFTLAAGGKLDLKDNDMIVHANVNPVINDARYNELYDWIGDAFGSGVWDGASGITSSIAATTGNTALGIIKNREFGFTTFVGHAVNPGSILIKYTYFGDITVDGQVDAEDLTIFGNNYGMTSGANWGHGSFDYDDDIDGDDLTLFANNYGLGIGNPL